MSCKHKFYAELQLEHLEYEPTTLIIGTFNPGWDNIENSAPWFYGRTHDVHGNQNNNFWDVLPQLYNEPTLIKGSEIKWKEFCFRNKIALTDLIACIDDAEPQNPNHLNIIKSFSDDSLVKSFKDFEYVDLVKILQLHPSIRNVYITRSTSQTFWRKSVSSLKKYASANSINVASIMTPSGYAYFQQGTYNKLHPDNMLTLPQFILMSWKNVWHQID
jgi:hypothetical protein